MVVLYEFCNSACFYQAHGLPVYMGQHTSFLYYDGDQERWLWIDKKDNKSFAFSGEKMESLLLGSNQFDFSNFRDNCVEPSKNNERLIQITSCSEGSFTCDDGQCIYIEERCDQTPNCADQSD